VWGREEEIDERGKGFWIREMSGKMVGPWEFQRHAEKS